MKRNSRPPNLPDLLKSKIYKTGQTRGADDDVIFQNRVGRNGTVLIPYQFWNPPFSLPNGATSFENGYIVLIPPKIYFGTMSIDTELDSKGLVLGTNSVVFYETRSDWMRHNPEQLGWTPAESRTPPLGGQFVARIPATTSASDGDKINRGFTSRNPKGAGIRLYEYASLETIQACRDQLEALFWMCQDAVEVAIENGMSEELALNRRAFSLNTCQMAGLLDYSQMVKSRVIGEDNVTTCPLCLERLSARGFFNRMAQAEGREVPDLTITEINLFHVVELRYGVFNHRPYNMGWGHHHCNVVTKDSGIMGTLSWMKGVIDRNTQRGFTF